MSYRKYILKYIEISRIILKYIELYWSSWIILKYLELYWSSWKNKKSLESYDSMIESKKKSWRESLWQELSWTGYGSIWAFHK